MDLKTRILVIIMITLASIGCDSTKNIMNQEDLELVNTIIENDTFTIESEWAYPQNAATVRINTILNPNGTGGGINLIGIGNHFKKIGDSLSVYLPYYGVRQSGGGYNSSDVEIKLEGKPNKTEYLFNKKKGMHQYKFVVNHKAENLQIYVQIFPKLSTIIRINSSHRTSISYRGKVIME